MHLPFQSQSVISLVLGMVHMRFSLEAKRVWQFGAFAAIMLSSTITHLKTDGPGHHHVRSLSSQTESYHMECMETMENMVRKLPGNNITEKETQINALMIVTELCPAAATYEKFLIQNAGTAAILAFMIILAKFLDSKNRSKRSDRTSASQRFGIFIFSILSVLGPASLKHFLCNKCYLPQDDAGGLRLFPSRLLEVWHDFHPPTAPLIRISHSVTHLTFAMSCTSSTFVEVVQWRIFNYLLTPLNDVAHAVEDPGLGCARVLFEVNEVCAQTSYGAIRGMLAYPMNMIFLFTGWRW